MQAPAAADMPLPEAPAESPEASRQAWEETSGGTRASSSCSAAPAEAVPAADAHFRLPAEAEEVAAVATSKS